MIFDLPFHLRYFLSFAHGVGTSRWGEFGEGGLLWGECSGKSFDWFDGSSVEELLCKVCILFVDMSLSKVHDHCAFCLHNTYFVMNYCSCTISSTFLISFGYWIIRLKKKSFHLSR